MSDRAAAVGPLLSSLATLKRQFEAGAERYPFLDGLYVSAPSDQRQWLSGPFPVPGCNSPDDAICAIDIFLWSAKCHDIERIGHNIANLNTTGFDFGETSLLCHVGGSSHGLDVIQGYGAGFDQFRIIAEQAGHCLARLPARVLLAVVPDELFEWNEYVIHPKECSHINPSDPDLLPKPTPISFDAVLPPGRENADRWTMFLYWLAWRGASVLRADRRTWARSGSLIITGTWSPTRTAFEPSGQCGVRLLRERTFENTRHYFSSLKNLFLASAHAIDWISASIVGGTAAPNALTPDERDGVVPPGERKETNALGRLVVSRNPPRAQLDGQSFDLTDVQAAFVDILHRNLGHLVVPATFDEDAMLAGTRRDRVCKGLPTPLRDKIQGKSGGGYKMDLA